MFYIHVLYEKATFKTFFSKVTDDQKVQMRNKGRSRVVEIGTVELNFAYGNKVTLVNLLHVLDMHMNLVSGDILGKPDIKFVYELGELILTYNSVFVGKRLF